MKRCTIITYKDGVYELPHELPNGLKLRILRNSKVEKIPKILSVDSEYKGKLQICMKIVNIELITIPQIRTCLN